MSKESFKQFAKTHPELAKSVLNNQGSWQKYYEVYEMYGEDSEVWRPYLNQNNGSRDDNSLQELFNMSKKVDLETIFKEADFIFPAFATNEETSKLITDELINKMNGNSFINVVNNPRELYNHDLLLNRAEKEEISYAFELYDNEKKMYDYKGNIMATAPYAFYTKEAIDRLVTIWCDNVVALSTGKLQNVVFK